MSARAPSARHANGRKAASSAHSGRGKNSRPAPAPQEEPDLDPILERMFEALSIIATAASALQSAEDPTVLEDVAEKGDMIHCLAHGVAELRRALSEVGIALEAVTP